MASLQTGCVVFVRFVQMICLIIAFSLVAFPSMDCRSLFSVKTDTIGNVTTRGLGGCKTADSPLAINHWSDGGYDRLKGQYFVFVSAVIFSMVSLALILASCCSCLANKHAIATICGFGALIMFIAGIVEAWYAAGFGILADSVDMWIGGAVLCFMTSLLYIIDITLSLKVPDE